MTLFISVATQEHNTHFANLILQIIKRVAVFTANIFTWERNVITSN